MGIMDRMMEFMMGRMSQEDKDNMMGKMMGKFFVDMTAEDKQKMMEELAAQELEHKQRVEFLYTEVAFPQTDGG